MTKQALLTCSIGLLFFSCAPMYQPSASDPIRTAINHLQTSSKSYHGKHKKILIHAWGHPGNISRIGDIEIYQYWHNINFSSGQLAVEIDMFIEQDTVTNSKVKPRID